MDESQNQLSVTCPGWKEAVYRKIKKRVSFWACVGVGVCVHRHVYHLGWSMSVNICMKGGDNWDKHFLRGSFYSPTPTSSFWLLLTLW